MSLSNLTRKNVDLCPYSTLNDLFPSLFIYSFSMFQILMMSKVAWGGRLMKAKKKIITLLAESWHSKQTGTISGNFQFYLSHPYRLTYNGALTVRKRANDQWLGGNQPTPQFSAHGATIGQMMIPPESFSVNVVYKKRIGSIGQKFGPWPQFENFRNWPIWPK